MILVQQWRVTIGHFFHPPPFFVRSGDSLKQLPGFYALMTRRRSEDYESMLQEVVRLTNPQAQQCMTLLPHENMGPAFYALKAECDLGLNPHLAAVMDYVEHTWIGTNAIWSPKCWSVNRRTTRTNNDAEGWHRCLNSQGQKNLPFYVLVDLLAKEAKTIPNNSQHGSGGYDARWLI